MKHQNHNTTFFRRMVMGVCLTAMLATTASATGLQGSIIYTGGINLLNDLTTVLTALCPIAGCAAALYFVIRRSMADEHDGKMCTKRITTSIICGVGGMLVSGLIAVLTGYFTA